MANYFKGYSVLCYNQRFILQRVIKERDEEREKLRTELHKSREQIHILTELVHPQSHNIPEATIEEAIEISVSDTIRPNETTNSEENTVEFSLP